MTEKLDEFLDDRKIELSQEDKLKLLRICNSTNHSELMKSITEARNKAITKEFDRLSLGQETSGRIIMKLALENNLSYGLVQRIVYKEGWNEKK